MYRVVLLIFLLLTPVFAENDFQEVVSVEAVNVFLTARDSNGKLIRDLKSKEITVLENGISQPILDISNLALEKTDRWSGKDVPLSVTFAMDISASMKSLDGNQNRMDIAKSAVLMLMDELKQNDQMMLTSFGRFPRILTESTLDKRHVEDLLLLQKPNEGKTALYDSLSEVLDKMENLPGRRILVLCSDGEDNASKMEFESFLAKLAATDILILAFTVPSLNPTPHKYEIEKMAQVTGGYAFFPQSVQQLQGILTQLRRAMRNQYSLWYRPSNRSKDGNWRTIQILCNRPGIEVYHRSGYFAR
jgi:Ca-activated chloride channel family protein